MDTVTSFSKNIRIVQEYIDICANFQNNTLSFTFLVSNWL